MLQIYTLNFYTRVVFFLYSVQFLVYLFVTCRGTEKSEKRKNLCRIQFTAVKKSNKLSLRKLTMKLLVFRLLSILRQVYRRVDRLSLFKDLATAMHNTDKANWASEISEFGKTALWKRHSCKERYLYICFAKTTKYRLNFNFRSWEEMSTNIVVSAILFFVLDYASDKFRFKT